MVGRPRKTKDAVEVSEQATPERSSSRKRQLSKRMQEYMDDKQKSKRRNTKSSKPSILKSVETFSTEKVDGDPKVAPLEEPSTLAVSSQMVEVANPVPFSDENEEKDIALCSNSNENEVPQPSVQEPITVEMDAMCTEDSTGVIIGEAPSQDVVESSNCAEPGDGDCTETVHYDQHPNMGIDEVLEQTDAHSSVSIPVPVELEHVSDMTPQQPEPMDQVVSMSAANDVVGTHIIDQSDSVTQTAEKLQILDQQGVEEPQSTDQAMDTFDVQLSDQSKSLETHIDQSKPLEQQLVDQDQLLEQSGTDKSHFLTQPLGDQSPLLEQQVTGQSGVVLEQVSDQPGVVLERVSDQSPIALEQASDQSLVLKHATDQSRVVLEQISHQSGVVLEQVPNQSGVVLEQVSDQSGVVLEQVSDQSGVVLEQVSDQSEVVLEQVSDQSGAVLEQVPDQSRVVLEQVSDQSGVVLEQVPDQSRIVLEQVPDQSQTLHLGIESAHSQDAVVTHLNVESAHSQDAVVTHLNVKVDDRTEQTSSGDDNVEILLSSDDTVTQALLESFMQDNSDAMKVKDTQVMAQEDELKEHRIAPNIKLTERVQVDENGKKHTVVYISADNTVDNMIHNNSHMSDGLPLMLPAAKTKHAQQMQTNNEQRDMVIEVYVGPQAQGGKKIQDVKVLNTRDIGNPLQTSSGLELFSCNQCDFTTDRKFNLIKHIKIRHDDRPHVCPVPKCSYSARTFSNLKRHQLTHSNQRQFACSQCDLKFKQKIHLDKHINYIHKEKSVKCDFCDYVCANRIPDLKLHMKRRHLKSDPDDPPTYLECEHCGFLAASKKDLKQHFKFHKRGPELKLFCEHCSFVTDAKSRLARHRMIHTKEKPFSCTLCGYRASQKEHIRRHHRTRHRGQQLGGILTDEPTNSPSAPPGEPVSIADSLPTELDDQHPVEFNVDDVVVETSVELSSADSSLAADASNNSESASGITVGGQLTAEKKTIKYEPPDYSQRAKSFACTHCTMRFVRLLSLYKHLHTQHSDILSNSLEEKLTCVVCDFRAQSHKALLVHMRKHNNHEACDDEDPGFLYVCVLCKYMNSKRRNLYQHLKKKHKISMMVKKDGSVSCVVEPNADVTVVSSSAGQKVTEVVGMSNEGIQGEAHRVELSGTEANRVVNLLDLANSLTHKCDISHLIQRVDIETGKSEQAAAEAIVDLATQSVIVEEEVVGPLSSTGILESDANGSGQLQLTEQQIQALSAGDFIEINGETYKVETQGETVTAVLCDPPADTCSYVPSTNEDAPAFGQSEVVIMADTSAVNLPT